MSHARGKYDEALAAILVEEKSIIGFLSTVFNFLARRTDFYHVPEGPYENIGFPAGVAEELTVKVLRKCDPKQPKDVSTVGEDKRSLNDDIMCSTVAQEVEIEAEDDTEEDALEDQVNVKEASTLNSKPADSTASTAAAPPPPPPLQESAKSEAGRAEQPQLPPMQKNTEAYNGAVRENYSWAQTITDIDVTIRLPPEVRSSKDLCVSMTGTDMCVSCAHSKNIIVKGEFTHKVKGQETYWSLSKGQLTVHLEKQKERWWSALISSEPPIDLDKIDCSRPLEELPEDQVAKVRELQWNHGRNMLGLPTSEEMRNAEILKRAWNLDGSPFKGTEFDPSVLRP